MLTKGHLETTSQKEVYSYSYFDIDFLLLVHWWFKKYQNKVLNGTNKKDQCSETPVRSSKSLRLGKGEGGYL